MKKIILHLKTYIIRGVLASIPLVLSFYVLKFFYIFIDKKTVDFIHKLSGFRIPGLGIIFFLAALYLIGYLASNVIGKRFLNLLEQLSSKIPVIKTIYQVGKQVSFTLSLPGQDVLKRPVLVEYFRPGVWTIGFVTGTILDTKTNEKLLKVFIPTVPNPTSGSFAILKESQTIDPKWTVEETMKAVISVGIIGPQEMG